MIHLLNLEYASCEGLCMVFSPSSSEHRGLVKEMGGFSGVQRGFSLLVICGLYKYPNISVHIWKETEKKADGLEHEAGFNQSSILIRKNLKHTHTHPYPTSSDNKKWPLFF